MFIYFCLHLHKCSKSQSEVMFQIQTLEGANEFVFGTQGFRLLFSAAVSSSFSSHFIVWSSLVSLVLQWVNWVVRQLHDSRCYTCHIKWLSVVYHHLQISRKGSRDVADHMAIQMDDSDSITVSEQSEPSAECWQNMYKLLNFYSLISDPTGILEKSTPENCLSGGSQHPQPTCHLQDTIYLIFIVSFSDIKCLIHWHGFIFLFLFMSACFSFKKVELVNIQLLIHNLSYCISYF